MGVRKTTDFIEKLTWGLAAFMVACSVLTAYFVPTAHTESSVIMEQAVKEGATNPLNAPSGFAAPQTDGMPQQKLLLLILHSNFRKYFP